MKYIDKIRKMSVDELALALKTFTDLVVREGIEQFAKVQGINVDVKKFSKIEDFKYCLESEVEDE